MNPRRTGIAAAILAASPAVAAPPSAAPPTGTDGLQLAFALSYPQTLTVGLGYRMAAVSVMADYQPIVDQTFLNSSWDLAVHGYFPPIDATGLFAANGQIYVGLSAGQYRFWQQQTADASDMQVTGSFVSPYVGFQLYDGNGHQLETELGWFLPLSHSAKFDSSAPGVPDPTPPAYVRKSGWHVTLIRYVWSFDMLGS